MKDLKPWNANDVETQRASRHYDDLRRRHAHFTWGTVLHVYEVGPYEIVMYTPNVPSNCDPKTYDRSPKFHAFYDGKDISRGYDSFDAALVGVVAYKHDGPNTRADTYFLRAIGADS